MDRIERQIVLQAGRPEVWEAITRADRLSRWFGGDAEVDLRPGGRITVTMGARIRRGLVEAVEPPARLAFRWLPEVDGVREPGPRTRVEFTLEDAGPGTRLTVVERSLWEAETEDRDDALAGTR